MSYLEYIEDYTYELTFLYESDYYGCESPVINIDKIENLGYYEFNGCEYDYLKFKDSYLGIVTKKRKQDEKEAKIKELKEQIEECQNKLKELEGEE